MQCGEVMGVLESVVICRFWPWKSSKIMVGGRQVHTLTGHSGYVIMAAFSPDGNRVVSGSDDKLVMIWDTTTGAEVRSFVGMRSEWRGREVIVRAFPVGFGLREGVPGEWWGGLSRLVHHEGLTQFCLA